MTDRLGVVLLVCLQASAARGFGAKVFSLILPVFSV